MRVFRITLFFIIIVVCYNKVHAQTNLLNINDLSAVNIDNYSDDDLKAMIQRAKESGLTQSQIIKIAIDKGLPQSEAIKLQNRLHALGFGETNNANTVTQQSATDTAVAVTYDSSLSKVPTQKTSVDETIFGSELFESNSLVFEPNLHIPAPAGYILGPEDELIIFVYGYSEKKYDLEIDEHGEIYIPNVGPLYLTGLTIEQATEKIQAKLASTIYKAINSGQTKVQVTLGKIKSIRITIIGQAKKPGTYTVSSLTTLFNALYLCGGPTDMGSYRKIEIIRGDQIQTADLYDFLEKGSQKGNILLKEGDVIRIPYYTTQVEISGKVKRPGKFEMLDTENISDLLKYCGGFTDDAYRGLISVTRLTDSSKEIVDVPSSSFKTFHFNSSDRFVVRKVQDEFSNKVSIEGSVNRPGNYELLRGNTLKNLIDKAGGLKREAYSKRVTIFRTDSNKMPSAISVDLDSMNRLNQEVYLQKDDSVYVHSIFEFNENQYVTVEGNIRKPGSVMWRSNLTLNDLLLSVGGLTESGDSSNIEITRRIKNANVEQSVHDEATIYDVNLNDPSQAGIKLKPFDMVIVKTIPGYTTQRSVLMLGEVKRPGRYGLEKSVERISDLINRVGGFKASADSSSITIRRISKSNLSMEERRRLLERILNISSDSIAQNTSLREELNKKYDLISVNLSTALNNPNSSENLALEDGDIITVDRRSNLVKVSGEVYYPTIVPYKEGMNLRYYVERAGNFTSSARKSNSIVIHPDGKAESVKHFLFIRSYPSVTPRSEIYIPQKTRNNKTRLGVAELALLVSALGILANVIVNLKL